MVGGRRSEARKNDLLREGIGQQGGAMAVHVDGVGEVFVAEFEAEIVDEIQRDLVLASQVGDEGIELSVDVWGHFLFEGGREGHFVEHNRDIVLSALEEGLIESCDEPVVDFGVLAIVDISLEPALNEAFSAGGVGEGGGGAAVPMTGIISEHGDGGFVDESKGLLDPLAECFAVAEGYPVLADFAPEEHGDGAGGVRSLL